MNVMTKRGSIDNVVTYEHYCDRVNDLQNIPKDQITLGSVAIVLKNENDELEVYMATSGKEWVPLLENANNSEDSSGLDLIHICNSNEYDSTSKIPTLENPEENIIYLVPTSNNSGNLYDEWIYANDNWEQFGSGNINLDWANITNKPPISSGLGLNSIIENSSASAIGEVSHAEGNRTYAGASGAHAEGGATQATGINSHAEGGATIASGRNAHAEGTITTASGNYSHAEGSGTVASGNCSHASGTSTVASGASSQAGGINTTSSGYASISNGVNTVANHRSQFVFGDYNIEDDSELSSDDRGTYIEIVGNGTSNERSNARTLDWEGNEWLAGDLILDSGNNIVIGSSILDEEDISNLNNINSKLNIAQGSANAGKSLVVGNDGNITIGEVDISDAVKAALMNAFKHVVWDEYGANAYEALKEALNYSEETVIPFGTLATPNYGVPGWRYSDGFRLAQSGNAKYVGYNISDLRFNPGDIIKLSNAAKQIYYFNVGTNTPSDSLNNDYWIDRANSAEDITLTNLTVVDAKCLYVKRQDGAETTTGELDYIGANVLWVKSDVNGYDQAHLTYPGDFLVKSEGSVDMDSNHPCGIKYSTLQASYPRRHIQFPYGAFPYFENVSPSYGLIARFPIPVPDWATSVTVKITPDTQYMFIWTRRLNPDTRMYEHYNTTANTGWVQGTATLALDAATNRVITINCKYDSAGTTYPTEPTGIDITFEEV